jgi:p-cumate 2,3-dioxygenase beta subunit
MMLSPDTARGIEQFLYREAALLDAWDLDAWLTLYTKDCAYEVTPPGEDDPENLSPDVAFFLIADDRERLEQRAIRILHPNAHVENPRSRTRHLYSNIRIDEEGSQVVVHLNFVTYRNRDRITTEYMGFIRFDLVTDGDGYLIRRKRIMLDMDALIPQGKVSIFL